MAVFYRGSNSSLQSKSPPLSFSVSFIPPVCVFSLFYSAFTFSCILFKLSVIICYLSGAFKCMPPALDVPLDAQPSVEPPLCSFTGGRQWFKALCLLTFQVLHFSPHNSHLIIWCLITMRKLLPLTYYL